jgi:hypothetical protein
MKEGDLIRIPDRLTGFDDNKPSRPYCVVRVVGDPWIEIYVVPRTTEPTRLGTDTPARVIEPLDKRGWFLYRAYRLTPADVPGIQPIGRLPQRWLDPVLEQANLAEFDID